MLELDLFGMLITSLCVARDILYFCTGALVFVCVFCVKTITRDMDKPLIKVYVTACFVLWCWLYSKLIVL